MRTIGSYSLRVPFPPLHRRALWKLANSDYNSGIDITLEPVRQPSRGTKVTIETYPSFPKAIWIQKDQGNTDMTKLPAITRIGVRRIVIEVNRDLTVEQIEMLDETLKKLGLAKGTKVTLHDQQPRKVRPPRTSNLNRLPAHGKYPDDPTSEVKGAQSV
jgi:hypothetical protein